MSSIPKTTTSKITILLLLSSRFYLCLCDDTMMTIRTMYICSKRLYLKLGKTPGAFILNVFAYDMPAPAPVYTQNDCLCVCVYS